MAAIDPEVEELEIKLDPRSIQKPPLGSGSFGSVHLARFVIPVLLCKAFRNAYLTCDLVTFLVPCNPGGLVQTWW